MPVVHTDYRALPAAAHRALNFMVCKYNRNQADNETRYPPPFHALLRQQPRPASPHIRDALLTDSVSHSFAPPNSFIPPWSSFCQSAKARCQPLPKAWAECPHPLCKSFTTNPTHTFISVTSTTTTYSSIPSFNSFTFYSAMPLSYIFPFPALHIVEPSFPPLFAVPCSHFYQLSVLPLSRLLSIFQHFSLRSHSLLPLWNSFSPPFLPGSLSHTAWLTKT